MYLGTTYTYLVGTEVVDSKVMYLLGTSSREVPACLPPIYVTTAAANTQWQSESTIAKSFNTWFACYPDS